MNKKINILSSVDFTMIGEEYKELKKKTIFNFSINSKKKTLEKIKYADIYIASAYFRLDKNILDKAENLKIIFSPATGKDHLDLVEIKKKKIKLYHIAKEIRLLKRFTATSELVFGLILTLYRSLIKNALAAKNGYWIRSKFKGWQLFGKTIGIIGLGRLGTITAKIAKGFGMKIIAYDTNKDIKVKGVKNVGLEYLLKNSDIITIHIHLNKKNKNFIEKNKITIMKNDVILINTSRGKIINEADLLYFLKKRKHFRVALDVIDGEWLSQKDLKNHRLIKYSKINQNLLIVPHIGGSTEESIYGARAFQVKQILRLLKNKI